ncbi:MAG: cytochrome c [Gemmatimonadaceae bacterium]
MRRAIALGALLLVGCAPNDGPGFAAATPAAFARYDAGAIAGGPGLGARYAFGRPPTPAELSALDTDVGSDGAELPDGRGSVAQGALLYAAQCAACHGAKGEGAPPNPPLIGRDSATDTFAFGKDPKLVKTIGNYWPYATTVFDYVKRAMPLSAPGSLSNDQVYALTAYLLAENKVIGSEATMNAPALRAVRMPARDRFVADDRKGGPGIR